MTKAELRKDLIARRTEFAAEYQGDAGAHLAEALGPYHGQVLAGYMPMRAEIDPLPVMAQVAALGPVCVPVVVAAAQPLEFRTWTPDAKMIPGAFKALIPEGGAVVTPQVVIVPLVGFDRQGGRLGYGGGFYDRTLEVLRAQGPVTAIGFAWSVQEVGDLPLEPTDQPLDMIVTEAGVITPSQTGGPSWN